MIDLRLLKSERCKWAGAEFSEDWDKIQKVSEFKLQFTRHFAFVEIAGLQKRNFVH